MFISFPAAPRLVEGVLLDTVARPAPLGFGWSTNETTADDASKEGEAIQVSFVFADKPRLSYWCVRCPNLDGNPFRTAPTIVSSAGHLALLRVDFGPPVVTCLCPRPTSEYFLYTAGAPGRRPELDLLPEAVASHVDGATISQDCLAVSPRGRDSFVLATVMPWYSDYELHVFVPEWRAWTRHPLALYGGLPPHYRPRKAIVLGGGLFGWADLFHGVLLCDTEPPPPDGSPAPARFVPFPKLLPGNQRLYTSGRSVAAAATARGLRDVGYHGGLLWCVELEQLWTRGDRADVSGRDAVHDSESFATDPATEAHDPGHERAGWRLVTWYRDISWDCWRKGGVLSSRELCGGGSTDERYLQTSYPTLQADGGGGVVVYLRTMVVKSNGEWNDWLIGVDMCRMAVIGATLVSDNGSPARAPTYVHCALPKCV